MTVSSIIPVNNYTGNSSAKTFDFDFLIESQDELQVVLTNSNGIQTTLEFGVDYSINEIGNKNGSYIIFPLEGSNFEVLSNEEIISLSLTLPIKQESEFENSANLNLNILERTFDYIVRILQIMNRKIERSVKTQEGSNITPDEIIEGLQDSAQKAKLYAEESSKNLQEAQNSASEALQSENGAKTTKKEILELSENIKADIETGINNYKSLGMYLKDGVLYYKKENGEIVPYVIGTQMPVGSFIKGVCSENYVPDGCLPCDGAEYSKTQFPSLWENYLTSETYSLNTGLDHSGGKIQTDGTIKPWLLTVKGDSISDEVVFCLNLSEDVQTKQYITGDSGIYIENGKVYYSADKILINVSANGKLYIKATISENTPSEDYPYAYKISYAYSNDNSIYVDSTFPLAYAESFEILLSNPNYPVDLTKSYLNSTPLAVPKTLLNTCNYEDYATEIETYGQCAMFAVDTTNQKFRVPLLNEEGTEEKLKTFVVVANGQINESMMDWSAWASGLQSKLNKDHSNDEKPYITEVSDRSLLPSWYRIWSDGWCEQGGLATGGTSTSGAPVIFLKPFVQDDFLLSSNIISESSKLTNLATRYVNQFNVTREGFSAITGYNATSSVTGNAYEFTWQAKGYIK